MSEKMNRVEGDEGEGVEGAEEEKNGIEDVAENYEPASKRQKTE
jgi:hypothetical protein